MGTSSNSRVVKSFSVHSLGVYSFLCVGTHVGFIHLHLCVGEPMWGLVYLCVGGGGFVCICNV